MLRPRARIRDRLALAFVLTALIPVLASIWVGRSMVRQATARFFVPEVTTRLDQSLSLYQELARAVKARMRQEAAAIALDPELRHAVRSGDRERLTRALDRARALHPDVASLVVRGSDGKELAASRRVAKIDETTENSLEVQVPLLASGPDREVARPRSEALVGPSPAGPIDDTDDVVDDGPADDDAADLMGAGPVLVAVMVTSRQRYDERDGLSRFVDAYKRLELRRDDDERSALLAFAAILGITIVAAVTVGTQLARGVSRRIVELAGASRSAGKGDLTVRVPEKGQDEVTELARSFNFMVREVASSRARIEYLQRMGTWQEMARRLAHEIKNPLTPIQLAVQEVHRRCPDDDGPFRRLVDSTAEIVEDEVGTLRRLVSEFSEFARMPRAELSREDLAAFLLEQVDRVSLTEGSSPELRTLADLDVPREPSPVLLDRQLFRRVLLNLIDNAEQSREEGEVRVLVRLRRTGDILRLDVEDDGPGIPEELRQAVFEPYITGKADGTGLGLAIVKKIIMEHGGTITAQPSSLGGACLRIELPVAGSARSDALLEELPSAPPASQDAFRRADSMHYRSPGPEDSP